MSDSTPADRRTLLVETILDARKHDASVVFEAADPECRVEYDDRTIRLAVDADERERLQTVLEEYHVFKIDEPATRKAPEEVVYLSAVTDPKHAADFLEAVFRTVYGADASYELTVR